MPAVVVRVDQEECCGWPQGIEVDSGVRSETRARRHPQLRFEAWRWRGKPAAKRGRQRPVVHSSIFAKEGTSSHRRYVLPVVSTLTTPASRLQTVRCRVWA